MPKGGARAGAGRPKGTTNDKLLRSYTRQLRADSPGMHIEGYDIARMIYLDDSLPIPERRAALALSLPYERPSLHRIDHRMSMKDTRPAMELTDEELLRIIDDGRAGAPLNMIEGTLVTDATLVEDEEDKG